MFSVADFLYNSENREKGVWKTEGGVCVSLCVCMCVCESYSRGVKVLISLDGPQQRIKEIAVESLNKMASHTGRLKKYLLKKDLKCIIVLPNI